MHVLFCVLYAYVLDTVFVVRCLMCQFHYVYVQLHSASGALTEHCAQIQQLNAAFLDSRTKHVEAVANIMTALQNDVSGCLEDHENHAKQLMRNSTELLKTKIEAMEKVHTLLQ
jgi:hypothetical protein